jgi:hypothetical protein
VKLLGEEINTEVTVLASLRRSGDANHLAWSALKNQEVADANVVARDGDGVGSHFARWVASSLGGFSGFVALKGAAWTSWQIDFAFFNSHFSAFNLFSFSVRMVMVVTEETGSGDGMCNAVSSAFGKALDTTAERVVLTFVVVVAHITLSWRINGSASSLLCDANFGSSTGKFCSSTAEFGFGAVTFAELAFGAIEIGRFKDTCCSASDLLEFAVVRFVLDVELGVDVSTIRFLVARDKESVRVPALDGEMMIEAKVHKGGRSGQHISSTIQATVDHLASNGQLEALAWLNV